MEFHIIAPGREPDLVARKVDGQLVIVPPAPQPQPAVAPVPPAPGT